MNIHKYILFFWILLSCLLHSKENRPNIILIMADDLGLETMGSYGGTSYRVPNLDRLAENGARFEHCYSQPICTPSRVQIMTGKYNVRNYTKFGVLPRSETTFAHMLKENGYATCIAGKWQLGSEKDAPQYFGFDESLLWQHIGSGRKVIDSKRIDKRYENPVLQRNGNNIEYNNGEFAPDLMVEFISKFIRKNKEQPFLVYYPMILTHCPFVPTPHSDNWNPDSLGSESYKGDERYFGDMVEYVDHLVGKIEKVLEENDIIDNTYLIFTGDNGTDRPIVSDFNGYSFPGRKGTMTDGGTHVPLIVSCPGKIKSSVHKNLVDFSDFLPTFCEIAKVKLHEENTILDGRSFLPQLLGHSSVPRDYVYCWYNRDMEPGKTKATARDRRYKLHLSGDFYDTELDRMEVKPLKIKMLTPAQVKIYKKLESVLDYYAQFDSLKTQ